MKTAAWGVCVTMLATVALVPAAETPEAATYPLKPVAGKDGDGANSRYLSLDKDGRAEMPFATTSGKLRIKVAGDKIIVDKNDDGKFDQADGDGVAEGTTVEVPVKLAGKVFQYPLTVRLTRPSAGAKPHCVYLTGSVCLEAQVGQTVVRLHDSNLNGRFGDIEYTPDSYWADTVQIGSTGAQRPITK